MSTTKSGCRLYPGQKAPPNQVTRKPNHEQYKLGCFRGQPRKNCQPVPEVSTPKFVVAHLFLRLPPPYVFNPYVCTPSPHSLTFSGVSVLCFLITLPNQFLLIEYADGQCPGRADASLTPVGGSCLGFMHVVLF